VGAKNNRTGFPTQKYGPDGSIKLGASNSWKPVPSYSRQQQKRHYFKKDIHEIIKVVNEPVG
jgi:hypothetical protein